MAGGEPAGGAAVEGVVGTLAATGDGAGGAHDLDYGRVAAEACRFIRERVEEAGAGGVVFGLSGGIDSSVVAHLSERALGAGRCLAMIMPNGPSTPDSETDDGLLVASKLGLKHKVVPIGAVSDAAAGASAAASEEGRGLGSDKRLRLLERDTKAPAPKGHSTGPDLRRLAAGNLAARLRAALLYYEAQLRGYLVVGTDDRSEYLIGYFTKHGDGASDLLPIADLYKTQVQRLGDHLGVPRHIVEKAPSPHLWSGHDAAGELGMGYDVIDAILSRATGSWRSGTVVDEEEAVGGAAASGVAEEDARRVASLNHASAHKRALPPIARLRGLCAVV